MKARGKIESFEPTNVAGLDTRIWQKKGAASDVDGAVFSSRGEVVKIGGLQPFVEWRGLRDKWGTLTVSGNPFYAGTENGGTTNGEYITDEILSFGTFHWGGTTELLVAHYRKDQSSAKLNPKKEVVKSYGGTVFIDVLETDELRTIHSYRVSRGKPKPSSYPRFCDAGRFVIILVDGMRPMKWDGRFTTLVGIHERPPAPQASILRGQRDNGDAEENPTHTGDFWDDRSWNQDDATGISVQYFQTYINMYGQESNMSEASERLVLNQDLGLTAAEIYHHEVWNGVEVPSQGGMSEAEQREILNTPTVLV
jgi:hypothetical protein